ncbi:MAG: aminomethyl-transferring glycine dehydrogenase [Vicinamibacteria bacterium]|nr:aminomethyl-transferring glycine dehydrogenase [Vicinamibacteria bacterium]
MEISRDSYAERHIGPSGDDTQRMLAAVGASSLDDLVEQIVPGSIRLQRPLDLPAPLSESDALAALALLASRNRVFRSFIGMGYHDCVTPAVLRRNVIENPGWYTPYTPYQAEIAQGRLEALLIYQTMVADLTGLPVANASLLDEATAAAEAMRLCRVVARDARRSFFVAEDCHPQTINVLRTRALSLGVELRVGPVADVDGRDFGVLVQYPTTDGRLIRYDDLAASVHANGALMVVATDLLALALIRPPGEFGADLAVGSAQRFGVPMGFGGPHAAFFAARDAYKRQMPGRIVGVSRDAEGRPAFRLALQTREQHIRRDKATSNICTAQVLLAVIAGLYAVYHGPAGLRGIATHVHQLTALLARGLRRLGLDFGVAPFFDTLRVRPSRGDSQRILCAARERRMNLRSYEDGSIGVAMDETKSIADVKDLLEVMAGAPPPFSIEDLESEGGNEVPGGFSRATKFLTHAIFERHRSEHEFLRYVRRLESRDLSLTTSMIPLGSCTMKLNPSAAMSTITWPEIASLHPFAPADQAEGSLAMARQLEQRLAEITGFEGVSLQPNAGSQGEYAGLLAIRAYHVNRGEGRRDVCLIPVSAHGTNPASAVMAGLRVVSVACDDQGNVDRVDLTAKAREHATRLAALMITYPSTHGVFEEGVREICDVVHAHGGQVYMDGANMNAQVGLTRPAEIGADVCHLNLHKTFAIPHGGGGPGAGPIAVAAHLAPFLPSHPLAPEGAVGPVAAAPLGSACILPISWMYVAMLGASGLARATQIAILNANYMARRLEAHYPVLYRGRGGRVAHEFVLDARSFKGCGVEAEDVAKRLMDYGFHAPTVSFPVAGTLMIEPSESESKAEMDRFCDALISIREEIRAIEEGRADRIDNVLKRAPHTAQAVCADTWDRPYSRELAAFPAPWTRAQKFWPVVARIDNAWGDRNLACVCPS